MLAVLGTARVLASGTKQASKHCGGGETEVSYELVLMLVCTHCTGGQVRLYLDNKKIFLFYIYTLQLCVHRSCTMGDRKPMIERVSYKNLVFLAMDI